MEKEKFSERFKLTGEQKDFDFVDIMLWRDQALFVDPSLIVKAQHEENKKGNDEHAFATRAYNSLQSFFSTFFNKFKKITPIQLIDRKSQGSEGVYREENLLALLKYSKENNAFHTGYGSDGAKGTGCTPEMIYDVFSNMKFSHPNMFQFIKEPIHTGLFINDFAEDRSSDLTLSIILDVLCDFTFVTLTNNLRIF